MSSALLLDTQVWLWMQGAPERLNEPARALVEDPRVHLLLSSASSWEIAIKWALGRLRLPEPPGEYVPGRLRSSGIASLSITHTHALAVARLDQHHRDPFDRLLIAQARVEGIPILTSDPVFSLYPVERIEAG